MKTATFKEWDLTSLDDAFGLTQVWDSPELLAWQKVKPSIDEFEAKNILHLQKPLIRGGRAWNEVELENKFISPLILAANVEDDNIGYFLERPLKGLVGNYELSGIVDGIIATGFRDPRKPFFCMHEYKRSIENQGTPDAQALAAMLVAREQNNNEKPIYGMFIVGLTWNFMVLNGNEYCISQDYKAGDEDVFEIFQMLKALKVIILRDLV
jgi:hypothetical protein